MTKKKAVDEVDEPEGGIEIVPLAMMKLQSVAAPYGPQYVSGPLMRGVALTFPGVPVRVLSWRYVREQLLTPHTSSGGLLACLPEDMTLEKLAPSYRTEFGNNTRWPAEITSAAAKTV